MTAKQPAHTNVYAAFAAAQAEFTSPKQSGTNPHFKSKYSTLGDIFSATLPYLHKHGLVFTQIVDFLTDKPVLCSRIVFPGESDIIESVMPLEMAGGPQKFGSYITYMRRYAAACMFAVVDGMDDDGNAASAKPHGWEAPTKKPTPAPKRKVTPKKMTEEVGTDANPFDGEKEPAYNPNGWFHASISDTFPKADVDEARHWIVYQYTSKTTPDNKRTSSKELSDDEKLAIAEALSDNGDTYLQRWEEYKEMQ